MIKRFASLTTKLSRPFSDRMSQFGEYRAIPEDINAYRRQIVYRCCHLGIRELDLLVGSWAKKNIESIEKEDLTKFTEEVLTMNTPDLYKMIYEKDAKIGENNPYIKLLREYAYSSPKYNEN